MVPGKEVSHPLPGRFDFSPDLVSALSDDGPFPSVRRSILETDKGNDTMQGVLFENPDGRLQNGQQGRRIVQTSAGGLASALIPVAAPAW